MSHTPTPWRVNGSELNTAIWIESGIGKRVATIRPSDHDADVAAFIVRACNAHDELVTALHAVMKTHDDGTYPAAAELARAALAKVQANRYQRTPQQEQELEVMRSRGEI